MCFGLLSAPGVEVFAPLALTEYRRCFHAPSTVDDARGRGVDCGHYLREESSEEIYEEVAYQSNTRKARSVIHRLGRPSPSSSAKWTWPVCVCSSSQAPSGCRLDRSTAIASSMRASGTSPTERK